MRGGAWNNSSNAGLFALNLNNPRSNASDNVGCRSALSCKQIMIRLWMRDCCRHKGNCFRPTAWEQLRNCAAARGTISLVRVCLT